MLERITLCRDLVDARGTLLARQGGVLSVESVREAATRAPVAPRRPVSDSAVADDLHLPLADARYRHLFRGGDVQGNVARALLHAALPDALFDELGALRLSDPARYRHALITAAVSARMLLAAVGDLPAVAEMAAAGFVHDLGMRHVSVHLARNGDPLDASEVLDVASHPLLGAWHVAQLLGEHPAVEAALAHHWRGGHGYPALGHPPSRSAEVIAVASAFAALTQARVFRSEPYDARGAADVLIAEARRGHADLEAVRLLVFALRGGAGDLRAVRFGRERFGAAPALNRHTVIGLAPALQSAG